MFKEEDRVRIKQYTEIPAEKRFSFINDMIKYCGKIVKIKSYNPVLECYNLYGNPYVWNEEWLEPVESKILEVTENDIDCLFKGD